MTLDLALLLALTAMMWLVKVLNLGSFFNLGENAALVFGFILLSSYLCGRMAQRARMPMLTGYLLAGFLFGPHLLGRISESFRFLTPEILDELSVFNSVALGLIAFSAGGEIKLSSLGSQWKTILSITLGQCLTVFTAMSILLLIAIPFLPFPGVPGAGVAAGAALLFAATALANSPATAIAVILEFSAAGPMTTALMSVTVLKDVVVIILFSLVMIAAKLLLQGDATLDVMLIPTLGWEVIGSIAIGSLLGWLMGRTMKFLGRELPLIVLALSFIAVALARDLHLSGLLLCLSAGFTIENFTDHGELLIHAIERYSMPVFVLFFTITGAQLQLGLLLEIWPVVFLLVAVRLASLWLGTKAGLHFAGDVFPPGRFPWTGFLPQAGVTLGLAALIESEIPIHGAPITTVVVAAVAVNQLVGPILFRRSLLRSGEAGKAD